MNKTNYTEKSLNSTQRKTGNWVKLGVREVVLPKEKHTNCGSSSDELASKHNTCEVTQTQKVILRIYMHRQTYTCI